MRLPELLQERRITVYRIVQESKGKISHTTLYRLVKRKGYATQFSAQLVDVLWDVCKLKSFDELFEAVKGEIRKSPKRKR